MPLWSAELTPAGAEGRAQQGQAFYDLREARLRLFRLGR